MNSDIFDEEVFPEELVIEGKKLVREAGIEMLFSALACCGGLAAVLFGLNGNKFSPLIYVIAGTAVWSILCSLLIAFSKKLCRGAYKFSVLLGTLPFVGCVIWCVVKGRILSLNFRLFGLSLNWFESVLLMLAILFVFLQYLKTVFVTYFKLYESDETDAYIGKRTSQSMI